MCAVAATRCMGVVAAAGVAVTAATEGGAGAVEPTAGVRHGAEGQAWKWCRGYWVNIFTPIQNIERMIQVKVRVTGLG